MHCLFFFFFFLLWPCKLDSISSPQKSRGITVKVICNSALLRGSELCILHLNQPKKCDSMRYRKEEFYLYESKGTLHKLYLNLTRSLTHICGFYLLVSYRGCNEKLEKSCPIMSHPSCLRLTQCSTSFTQVLYF